MITRCVCFSKRFTELKKVAEKHSATSLEELQQYVKFGLNCQRCHPYVKQMLRSGETVFEVLAENKDS